MIYKATFARFYQSVIIGPDELTYVTDKTHDIYYDDDNNNIEINNIRSPQFYSMSNMTNCSGIKLETPYLKDEYIQRITKSDKKSALKS